MAVLNKTGISNSSTIQAAHITQSIDALTGQVTDYDITISGSLALTGSFRITSGNITSSGAISSSAGLFSTTLNTTGAITASIISASGNISSSTLRVTDATTLVGALTASIISASSNISSPALRLTGTGTQTVGESQIYLNGATLNRIDFNQNGISAPITGSTPSTGSKIVLYPVGAVNNIDYALGIEGGFLWSSVPSNAGFKWYGVVSGNVTEMMRLNSSGILSVTSISASSQLNIPTSTSTSITSTTPANGALIYATDNNRLYFRSGSTWRSSSAFT